MEEINSPTPAGIVKPLGGESVSDDQAIPVRVASGTKITDSAKPVAPKLNGKKIGVAGVILIILLAVLTILVAIPLSKAYADARKVMAQTQAIKDAAKSQDIKKITDTIVATKSQVKAVQGDLGLLGWTRFIPFFGSYTSDAIHLTKAAGYSLEAAEITARAVEPYADILGLKGQGTFTGGTAEDRIATLVQTLDKVTPQIDTIAEKFALVQKEVDMVDPNRYPKNFAGKVVKQRIVDVKDAADLVGELLTQSRPMVKQLPDMLGANSEKKYMVIFQNDKELRPTGGFITAYAIFRIDKGRIHLDSSNDIYKLDDTITKQVSPPDQIAKYLHVYGWRLRDSNFSPDFAESMAVFNDLYQSSYQKEKIDGIIAMDTHVLISLMNVIGPVDAYGTTFTTNKIPICDCPMVLYELEKYADEPKGYERGSRKDIIGVLLQIMMQKAMAAPKQIYGNLFQTAFTEARQKHILLYLFNPNAQKGVEALNFAGRIKTSDGDYLHINDANLAGAKSNLYVVQSVKREINITDSGADVTLTIDYKYPHIADNCSLERKEGLCLAGIYRDYQRIFLPAGTTVVNARGYESQSTTFNYLGHTVVDGFFTVVPQGLARTQVTYKVPGNFQKTGVYNALIQKQPGIDANHYQIIINNRQKIEFDLVEDKELSVKL